MLCEKCKIREANIQYTEVVNGVKKEHHFCAQCAKEMDFGVYAAIFDGEFPLGKLLSGLLGIEDTEKGPDKLQQIACPTCGTSYSEFVKDSRFGCADCYSVFGPLMEDSIKQLQGSLMHTGKTPAFQRMDHESQNEDLDEDGSDSSRNELYELDTRLKEALRFEDYETAAVCRDRIKELRKGNEGNA
ncbi:UvrB/UvrC motif-containing protein [Lacrimispora sp.]|uniref:UvrB/UvrC motif-containing protein n=1 Tax=Lacrimispora sp. TaxID=2719234 RepID=UPI0032E4D87A